MLKLLRTVPAFLAFLFLLIQQLIAASSTLWIAQVGSGLERGTDISWSLALFVASLTVVYIPATLYVYYVQKARVAAYAAFVDRFVSAFRGETGHWRDDTVRRTVRPVLVQESYLVIQETVPALFDGMALVLNVGLNLIALSLAVDSTLSAAFGVSVVLIGIVLLLGQERIARAAQRMQASRVSLQDGIESGWDNILLGNKGPLQRWTGLWSGRVRAYAEQVSASTLTNTLTANSALLVGVLPIAVWLVLVFSGLWVTVGGLVVVAVTLPRQVQVVQNLQALVDYLTQLRSMAARAQVLRTVFVPGNAVLPPVAWDRLTVRIQDEQMALHSVDEVMEALAARPTARVTIQGPNGAGKTSLLLDLKRRWGDAAVYLPPSSSLLFGEDRPTSSGERGQQALESLLQEDVRLLLLDEWDAHLDHAAARSFDAQLEAAASTRLIVEVRHRD